jgi:hypothetical protein
MGIICDFNYLCSGKNPPLTPPRRGIRSCDRIILSHLKAIGLLNSYESLCYILS